MSGELDEHTHRRHPQADCDGNRNQVEVQQGAALEQCMRKAQQQFSADGPRVATLRGQLLFREFHGAPFSRALVA